MDTVTSADGTPIAYTREGSGPAVVLVGGALDDGAENAVLGPALADHFTVFNYARRGRGASGDTPPHSLAKEIDDLRAVLEVAGDAHLFGASSGGGLALEAAAAGVHAQSVAVFDVPYSVGPDAVDAWRAYVADLRRAVADDDRDRALELFMRVAGMSDEDIAGARSSPHWAPILPLAHTLAYDAACLHDGSPPHERLASIGVPVLVITRSAPGPDQAFFAASADAVAGSVPTSTRLEVDAPSHVVDADTLGPALSRFYGSVSP